MNSINWHGDESVDDLYDHWIALVEEGNRAGLIRELSHGVNSREQLFRLDDDGALIRPELEFDSDEMMIRELAYGSDADKVIRLVRESDEHEVGENLR